MDPESGFGERDHPARHRANATDAYRLSVRVNMVPGFRTSCIIMPRHLCTKFLGSVRARARAHIHAPSGSFRRAAADA